MKPTTKITLCAILTALAIVSFVIENLFPPIIFAGARIGVSNIFILLTLIVLGIPYAYIALTVKTLLGSLFAGNISMLIYSLPAGAIALTAETLLLVFVKKISLPAVSVVGAVTNSAVQNIVFCIITGTLEILYYLPYLILIAVLSGLTIGVAVFLIVKRLPDKLFLIDEKSNT